jgi:hypothetical protein
VSPSTHLFGLLSVTSENVPSNIGGAHLPPLAGARLPSQAIRLQIGSWHP